MMRFVSWRRYVRVALALAVMAAALIAGMLASDANEGNVEAQSSLVVIPVDAGGERSGRLPARLSEKERRAILAQRERSLAGIKDALGMVLVPTYAPQGFSLSSSELRNGGTESTLRYIWRDGAGAGLDVFQTSKPARIEVPAGHYRKVAVGQYEGYVIEGVWSSWVTSNVKAGDEVPITWDPGRAKTLYFVRDGWTIGLLNRYVDKDSALSDDELVRIAESLQPY